MMHGADLVFSQERLVVNKKVVRNFLNPIFPGSASKTNHIHSWPMAQLLHQISLNLLTD